MAKETVKRVAKKAPAKKAPAKKAPAKKAPAKKASAKKAPAKKAVAKKAVAKKSVAKKAVAKKTTVKKAAAKRAVTKKAVAPRAVYAAPVDAWLNKEPALPVFLQNQTPEVKKDPVATQKYNQKTNNSVKFTLIVALVLLLGWGVNSFYLNSGSSGSSSNAQNSTNASDTDRTSGESGSAVDSSDDQSESTSSPTPTPVATSSSTTNGSFDKAGVNSSKAPASNTKPKTSTQSPRTFTSISSEQGAVLKWLAPKDIGNVVAFELYGRAVGQTSWVLLSTVTTEQLEIEVDLTPGETSTEFRVASLLDNDKQVFNKTIITLPGSLT
jgi:hypothetical protein